MNTISVRVASLTDAKAIAVIHVRTWQCAYRGQIPDEYLDSMSIEKREKGWVEILSDPKEKIFVAEIDGKVLGFCGAGKSRDEFAEKNTGEVMSIYVDPETIHKGVGSKMLAAALDYLKEQGYGQVTLWVLTTNQKAREFYEKKGFVPDQATKIVKREGFDLHETRYVMNLK